MKKLAVFLFVIASACANNKSETGNEIKLYKDSVLITSIEKNRLETEAKKMLFGTADPIIDHAKNGSAKVLKINRDSILHSLDYKKLTDSIIEINLKIVNLNTHIENLELEQKKY